MKVDKNNAMFWWDKLFDICCTYNMICWFWILWYIIVCLFTLFKNKYDVRTKHTRKKESYLRGESFFPMCVTFFLILLTGKKFFFHFSWIDFFLPLSKIESNYSETEIWVSLFVTSWSKFFPVMSHFNFNVTIENKI